MFLAKIYVTLKPAVNDPPGQTVLAALRRMGYGSASDVRVGKFLQLKVEGMERLQAERQVDEMCQKLLANPVIEDYRYELEEIAP
jgi:phosphoribosylformylglycinamidine synthase